MAINTDQRTLGLSGLWVNLLLMERIREPTQPRARRPKKHRARIEKTSARRTIQVAVSHSVGEARLVQGRASGRVTAAAPKGKRHAGPQRNF